MKSAYELAMERMGGAETQPLTAEQKEAMAEVDSLYQSKIAEREILFNQSLQKATASGNFEEVERLRQEFTAEKARLENERNAKKEKVRAES